MNYIYYYKPHTEYSEKYGALVLEPLYSLLKYNDKVYIWKRFPPFF
jgi:hypothetical protein